MESSLKLVDENNWNVLSIEKAFYQSIKGPDLNEKITQNNPSFQTGGELYAWRYLDSFIK